MSTKTTFKRVALVAVAALGLGLLAAAPSMAQTVAQSYLYCSIGDGGAISNTTTTGAKCGGVAGVANTVTLSTVSTASDVLIVASSGVLAVKATGGVVASGGGSATIVAANTGTATFTLTTPVAGTQTVSVYTATAGTGIYSSTAAETVTVTVTAGGIVNVYSSSTVYGFSGDTSVVSGMTSTTDAAFSVTSVNTASTTPVAGWNVTQLDGNGNALTSGYKTVAVTTTLGSLQTAHGTNVGSYVTASAAASQGFWLAPNGQTGVATVTVAVNGVTVKTYTVKFFSTTAGSLVATTRYNQVAAAAVTGYAATSTETIGVVAKDANGNAITSGLTLTAASSNTAVGTVSVGSYDSTNGFWPITVTGVASGTITVTVTDSADSLTATASVNVSKAVASTVALSLDKTAYDAGTQGTVTITAKDANGAPVADGTYTAFLTGGLSGNYALSSTVLAADVKFKDGIATATFYAPVSGSTLILSGTTGTAATLVSAAQSLALSVTADVSNPSTNDAVDAANAATDAANYAADAADAATTAAQEATAAAQAAQDSADAATAAVVALGLRVNVLMASVRAQLTSLSNLLVRIIKKTHA